VQHLKDITQAPLGRTVSAGQHIEAWRNREIVGDFSYLYLDGMILKHCWAREVKSVSVLFAVGLRTDGRRHVVGAAEGQKDDAESWCGFLRHLKAQGLKPPGLIISDACRDFGNVADEVFPEVKWERGVVRSYRNVFGRVPDRMAVTVARMLEPIYSQEDHPLAAKRAEEVVNKLHSLELPEAAELVAAGACETITYYRKIARRRRQR